MSCPPDDTVHCGQHLHEKQTAKDDTQVGDGTLEQFSLGPHPSQKSGAHELPQNSQGCHTDHDKEEHLHHRVVCAVLLARAHVTRHHGHPAHRQTHQWADEHDAQRRAHSHGGQSQPAHLAHPKGVHQAPHAEQRHLRRGGQSQLEYLLHEIARCQITLPPFGLG